MAMKRINFSMKSQKTVRSFEYGSEHEITVAVEVQIK